MLTALIKTVMLVSISPVIDPHFQQRLVCETQSQPVTSARAADPVSFLTTRCNSIRPHTVRLTVLLCNLSVTAAAVIFLFHIKNTYVCLTISRVMEIKSPKIDSRECEKCLTQLLGKRWCLGQERAIRWMWSPAWKKKWWGPNTHGRGIMGDSSPGGKKKDLY